MVIFKISETVLGWKRKCRRLIFHYKVEGCIRSAIAKGYEDEKEDNRGIGKKFSKVWIQEEHQTGKLEILCGIKQAPIDKNGIVALLPFQIQDPEVRGDDKRIPYLIYFLE